MKFGHLSTNQMRNAASQWNLGCDQGLLLYLQDFSQKLLSRYHNVRQMVEALEEETGKTVTEVGNLSTRFLMLSNTQFIESRIYEDDIKYTPQPPEKVNKDEKIEEEDVMKAVNAALKSGLAVVSEAYEVIELQGNGMEGDDASLTAVLKTRNPYEDRRLPNIIGSPLFNIKESFVLGFDYLRTKPPEKGGKGWTNNEEVEEYPSTTEKSHSPMSQGIVHDIFEKEEESECDHEWAPDKKEERSGQTMLPGCDVDEVSSASTGEVESEWDVLEPSSNVLPDVRGQRILTKECVVDKTSSDEGELFPTLHEEKAESPSRKVPVGGVSMFGPGFVPATNVESSDTASSNEIIRTNNKSMAPITSLFDDLYGSDDIFSVLDQRKSNRTSKPQASHISDGNQASQNIGSDAVKAVKESSAHSSGIASSGSPESVKVQSKTKINVDLFDDSDTEDLFSSNSSLTSKSSGVSGDMFSNQRAEKNVAVKSRSLHPIDDLFSESDLFTVSKPQKAAIKEDQVQGSTVPETSSKKPSHDDIFKDMFDDDDDDETNAIFSIPKQLVPTKKLGTSPRHDLFADDDDDDDLGLFNAGKGGSDNKFFVEKSPTSYKPDISSSSSKADLSASSSKVDIFGSSSAKESTVLGENLSTEVCDQSKQDPLSASICRTDSSERIQSETKNKSVVKNITTNVLTKTALPTSVIAELKSQISHDEAHVVQKQPADAAVSEDKISFDEPFSNTNLLPSLTKKRAQLPQRRPSINKRRSMLAPKLSSRDAIGNEEKISLPPSLEAVTKEKENLSVSPLLEAAAGEKKLPSFPSLEKISKEQEKLPVCRSSETTREEADSDFEDIFATVPPPLLADKKSIEEGEGDGLDSSMVFDDDFDIFSVSKKPSFRKEEPTFRNNLFDDDDDDVEDIFK